ncbi:MAG: class I SAM-dependent methyltransferase [Methylococcaceae bacterium]
MVSHDSSGYCWNSGEYTHAHAYLLPTVINILNSLQAKNDKRLFDLGCGNGSVAHHLKEGGWKVTGVDPSIQGIEQANIEYPDLNLNMGSAYDDLFNQYGAFPVVLSLEVVEHLYSPREYAKTLFNLTEKGGVAIVSTPYHSYFKNLALAFTGKMDAHFTVLWNHGHIKFWSIRTLSMLLEEVGFRNIHFYRTGRIPVLAKSMVAVAKKP